MAIDRNRAAQQAEKLVLQGKVMEAIVLYESLVRDNPRDMNTINKIGDLYSRQGKRREAILQYNKIGEFYAKDGFFLKAIAIYKKILKLDSSCLEAYESLADLYARQGLVLEARSQYQMVAEQYVRSGDLKRAIGAYHALVRVDPDNLKPRALLADLLVKDGRAAEAAEEYARLGAELERRGQSKEAQTVYQKASSIQPGSPAVAVRLAASQVAAGNVAQGIKLIQDALRKPGDHRDLLALLCDLHMKLDQLDEAESALRRAIESAPDRVELRLKLANLHVRKGDAVAAFDAVSPHIAGLTQLGQLAGVTALLEGIDQKAAGHLPALLKLTEIYGAQKKDKDFSRCAHRLLDLCIERGDYATGGNHASVLLKMRPQDAALKKKIDQLAAARSAASGGAPTPATEPAEAATPTDDAGTVDLSPPVTLEPEDEDFVAEHMTEADVFVKYGLSDRAVEQLATVVGRFPLYVPALVKLKEIYLEDGNREGARGQMAAIVRAHLAAGDRAAADEEVAELRRFDPNCRELAEITGAPVPEPEDTASPRAARATIGAGATADEELIPLEHALGAESGPADLGTTVDLEPEERVPTKEELAEVDSYLARGLRDQAVTLLRRLAGECGSHPDIVSRMRAAMALTAAAAAPQQAEASAGEFEITIDETESTDEPGIAALQDMPVETAELSDLAAEIDAALVGQEDRGEPLLTDVESAPEGESLDEIVQAFRKGIEQQIGAEDFGTHYNLGIAYKEMGLLDEAIGEFQFAAKDPGLLVDCCSMLGICFREKGMGALAAKWYRRGVEAAGARDEETVLGLRYDLAELLTELGEHKEALELYIEVFGINSQYRDVSTRIKAVERQIAR